MNGRYVLGRRIGAGGMATVYLAHDTLLDRDVAIKLLAEPFADDPAFAERLKREARAVANLNHPNIVSVFDMGTADGIPSIVMEYVRGQTLADVLVTEGPLAERRAVEISALVAAALEEAHNHGIVHRDIKPHNVIVDSAGHVKVTDFGIARAVGVQPLTEASGVLGTAHYMAPEQAQGLPVDARSDVYSLGILLYELLAGRPPFDGDTAVAIALQHVRTAPAPLGSLRPDVTMETEAAVHRALAKDPDERFPSAYAFRQALDRVQRRLSAAPRAATVPLSPRAWSTKPPSPVGRPRPPRSRAQLPVNTVPVHSGPAVRRPHAIKTSARQDRTPVAIVVFGLLAFFLVGAVALGGLLGYLSGKGGIGPLSPTATSNPRGPTGTGALFSQTATPTVTALLPTGTPRAVVLTPRPVVPTSPPAASTRTPTVSLPPRMASITTPPTAARSSPSPKSSPTQPVLGSAGTSPTPPGTASPLPVVGASPVDVVRTFYALVAAHHFREAAELWTPQLRSTYPPAQYIDGRFAAVQSLTLNRAEQVGGYGQTATVAVDLMEVDSGSSTPRHFIGTWQVVRVVDRWLLNQPTFSGT